MGEIGAVHFSGLRRAADVHAGRHALIAMSLAWLPLALFALMQGSAIGPPAQQPFALDFAAHVRFLLAVPLLILAGPVVDQRLSPVVADLRATLVEVPARPRFDAMLAGLVRLRDRFLPDLILLAAAWGDSILIGIRRPTGWQLGPNGAFSPAGLWFMFVSQPIFEYLFFRWLWRIVIWTVFLVRFARLPLTLIASHPDRAGGLAVLGEAQPIFAVVALPLSMIGATNFARQIAYGGAKLAEFQRPLVLFVVVVFALVLGPLLAFAPKLIALKRRGLLEFGGFAHEYTRRFEDKWLGAKTDEDPLGTQDLQALADLGNSFRVVREMSIVPVEARAALTLLVAAVAPMIVPVAVQISVPEVVRRLVAAFLGHGG